MRTPVLDVKFFKERRKRLANLAGDDVAFVFFSGTAPTRSNDTNYKFRPESNFFYLTGFEEEQSIFVFRPGKIPESTLFVNKKDPLYETWEGFLYGKEAAKKVFQMDETYLNSEFSEKAPELLNGVSRVYYKLGADSVQDQSLVEALKEVLRMQGRKGSPLQTLGDPNEFLASMRVIKTDEEIELMRKAAALSAKGHVEVMKATHKDSNEQALQGVFLSTIMQGGAKAEAYNSIVATGSNATTLHYVFNDEDCKDGELLLIDAGAEYRYYAGDITRTFPVNGKYSPLQKKFYQAVLDVQKEMIARVKPGVSFKDLTEKSIELLTQALIELGLLSGDVESNIEKKTYKKYYPHGLGHFLGIDVHDVGFYEKNNEPVLFEPGMCLTIEPGLYVPLDDESAPKEMRGLGVRIEDDILVTKTGCEVMTSDVPKEIEQIEALMAR